jgi:hypothetical protein
LGRHGRLTRIWEAYPELNAWLSIDAQMVAAVSLGYPDIDPRMPHRKALDEVATWLDD